jgi:hypothetical protein
MKNLLLISSILCFMACKEEKPKKIVLRTSLKCEHPDYRKEKRITIIKVDSTKLNTLKKI